MDYLNSFIFIMMVFLILFFIFNIPIALWDKKNEDKHKKTIEHDCIVDYLIIITALISFILSVSIYTMPVVEKNVKIEIVSSPKNGEYYNIKNNKIIYYTEKSKVITSNKLNTTYIKENYALKEKENPYISYKIKYNIIGIELTRNSYKIYLPKK